MRIRTLLLFLIGDRQAILDIAADRRALWVGFIFVLSAGLAREYDGHDLLREPWHLLIPLGASLGASMLLFAITGIKVVIQAKGAPSLWIAYRSFLTLFWMTAPLAWLYAIPYERFLAPADALRANLITLALVALWRVALMVRVASVFMGYPWYRALFLVMAFSDGVALISLTQMPMPIIAFMGGVRLTESERLIESVTINTGCFGYLTGPIWAIGAGIVLFGKRADWEWPTSAATPGRRTSILLWVFAAASLAVWAIVLPQTQPEQQLRRRAERDLKAGHIAEALAEMSRHSPSDYPPHWDPPPHIWRESRQPDLLAVMEVILEQPPAPWVEQIYVEKFKSILSHGVVRSRARKRQSCRAGQGSKTLS